MELSAIINVNGGRSLVNACASALKPQQTFSNKRASYKVEKKEGLKIKVKAKDITAFKAVVNSLTNSLKMVNANWRIVRNGKKEKK